MDAKFVQDGKYLDYTAPADVEAGGVVIQGSLVGVANQPIASGATGAIATEGVFEVTKLSGSSGAVFSAGADVYWNATSSYAQGSASGLTKIGVAVANVTSGGETVRVKL